MADWHLAISGVIAAGKTTLVRALARDLDVVGHEERPDQNPYFSRFYADQPKWAFYSFVAFVTQTLDAYPHRGAHVGVVHERVVEEHLEVFGEEFRARGFLADDDLTTLRRFVQVIGELVPRPELLIHIELDPEESLRRVVARNDPSERGVSLEYLTALSLRYKPFIDAWPGRVLRIDGAAHDFRRAADVDDIIARIHGLLRTG